MSPLIDCVFILLIFFIVTTTFVEEDGLEVDKPEAAAAASQMESTSVMIRLTERGEVLHEGRSIGLSGVQPLVKRAVQKEEDAPVIVQAEEGARSGIMMRIIDEATIAGATKISVANVSG